MCNRYRQRQELEAFEKLAAATVMRLVYPEGRPNVEPRDDIRSTDPAPIVCAGADNPGAPLPIRRARQAISGAVAAASPGIGRTT
jgi:putative SOS response-associated peptidase YedK